MSTHFWDLFLNYFHFCGPSSLPFLLHSKAWMQSISLNRERYSPAQWALLSAFVWIIPAGFPLNPSFSGSVQWLHSSNPKATWSCQASHSWKRRITYHPCTVTAQTQSQDNSERSTDFHLCSPLMKVLPGRGKLPGLGWSRRVNQEQAFTRDCDLLDFRVF